MKQLVYWAIFLAFGFVLAGCEKDEFDPLPQHTDSAVADRGTQCILGTISLPGGEESIELNGREELRFRSDPLAMPYAYLITDDEEEVILKVSRNNVLNFKDLPPGIYRVRAFSYLGEVLAEPGMLASEGRLASVCYQLTSNYIRIINSVPNGTRLGLLEKYAPLLKFDYDEVYYPSSVEWAFPFLKRVKMTSSDCQYCYRMTTRKHLSVPNGGGQANYGAHMDFFSGRLQSAKAYTFFVDRSVEGEGVVDLVYFIYYPWNWGKHAGPTVFGNHVGDWENIVVRLRRDGEELIPLRVYYPAHNFTNKSDWAEVEKVEGTHPVAYVANGSHGHWSYAGSKRYGWAFWYGLWDHFDGEGERWNTWQSLEAYDFREKEGLDGQGWPLWMSDDFTDPGVGDPSDPASGPVYRWGNPKAGWVWFPFHGYEYRLVDGPTGPVSKGVLADPNWDLIPGSLLSPPDYEQTMEPAALVE